VTTLGAGRVAAGPVELAGTPADGEVEGPEVVDRDADGAGTAGSADPELTGPGRAGRELTPDGGTDPAGAIGRSPPAGR
jgi:hypothetical protein